MSLPSTVEAFSSPATVLCENGVYFPDYQLPDYDGLLLDPEVVLGEAVEHEGIGTTFTDAWQMNDEAGTSYQTVRCYASNPRTNVWVVKDSALATQPEGLNMDVARHLMAMGFNVLIKSMEVGSSIPLSQRAYYTHKILNEYVKQGLIEQADAIAIEGYSLGSMIAFGTIGYAKRFNRQVIYSNLTDPCVAKPIGRDIDTVKKATGLPADVGLLVVAFGLSVVASPKRGKHLLKTVDFSANGARQIYRVGKPILDGEAGMMAARTPRDTKATVAFFRRTRFNDKHFFGDIFEGYPDVRLVHPEGGHGGGLAKRIIGNIAVRFGRLGDELYEGKRTDEINYPYVINGGLRLVRG